MNDSSQDFMVDIVNSEPAISTPELITIILVVLLTVTAIIWWIKRK